ncbi:MAG: twin-arginine translocase subunit TatC, partial [Prolixibacteraceae bacterium]|nr:twin-arginine translocase subunit TatC [Prolixibacteraceae bacterium]
MSEDTNREEQTTKKKTKKTKQGEMSFLEHLEEFRWHIVRSAMAIFAFAIVAFIMKDFIFDTVILNPRTPDFWTNRMFAKLGDLVGSEALKINQEPLELISIKIAGQFSMHIWTSIIAGFLLASPVVFYEFWRFVKPALYDKEKKHASGAVFYTSALFMMGVLFGYYLIVPLSVHFLGTYNVSSDV